MTKQHPTLDGMLAEGFTRRFAEEYLALMRQERDSGMFDADYLEWAHSQGFLAESACAYGLREDNLGDYLSDYDYWRLWPLNGWQRIWINDKLTLHALLSGTDLAGYLPTYYYYTAPGGLGGDCGRDGLLSLNGSPAGVEGLLSTVREQGEVACKPCNGTEANGFHRLGFAGGEYTLDGAAVGEEGVRAFVRSSPNYVFTEFIRPEASLAAINPLIHTIRVLVVNADGASPRPLMSYLRFAVGDGATGSGANYLAPTEADIAAYNVRVDLETGRYGGGKLVYANRVVDAPAHPASGVLAEGEVPGWDGLMDMVRRVSLKVAGCEYLGFDACMTDKGPRIMEINSHSGIKYLQLFQPIMSDERIASYFREKLARIDALDEAARAARNVVVR